MCFFNSASIFSLSYVCKKRLDKGIPVANTFSSSIPLYHIDAYRLEDIPRENKNIGLEEVIEGDGVAIIEWPKFIEEFLNFDDILDIVIKINENNERQFTISSKNERFSSLFNELKEVYKL